jgi:hypothetical protein
VRLALNVLAQQQPREEAQRQLALACANEEEVDRVGDLRARHVQIDDAEVLWQAVPHKHAA